MARSALIAGATGLVGAQLFARLLAAPDYARVVALGRRPPDGTSGATPDFEFMATDFISLGERAGALKADDAFCCLGTTLAAAGSRPAFARVDLDMVVAFARAARAAGVQHFMVVSALGANPRSVVFYSRIKGDMEAAVAALDFPCSAVVRPSLLLGRRAERRSGERLAQRVAPLLSPLLCGPLRSTRTVSAASVAEALLELARRGTPGHHVHRLPLQRP